MSDIDGHVLGPLDDQANKIKRNDTLYENTQFSTPPDLPKLKFNPSENFSFNPNTSNVQQYVEDAVGRIRINGQSASFNGGSIDFNIPINKTPEIPLISENTHPIDIPKILSSIIPNINNSSQLGFDNKFPAFIDNQFQNNSINLPKANESYIDVTAINLPPLNNAAGNSQANTIVEIKSSDNLNGYPISGAPPDVNYASPEIAYDSSKQNINIPLAIRGGDTSYFSSTYVPVYLTRGDNNRKILCDVLVDSSYVVEGGEDEDVTGYLPAPDSYYTAGASEDGPPFFPSLSTETPEEGEKIIKLRMTQGFIHTQKNVEDAMVDLPVTGMPVEGSEITVAAGQKCYVKASENAYGVITNPTFEISGSFPSSIPPKLIGGDDQTGSIGTRYWRLCEINGEDSVTIHRTGIIEHFIPRRIENANNTISSNQGRFYKEYLDDENHGIYQMRVAKGLRGLCVEEDDEGTKDYLKLLMPPGTDGAILHFTGASPSNDEIGSWVSLPAPSSSSPDGYEWVLKNVPSGPPVWVQRPIIPTGSLNDMLRHNGTKWVVFAAPPSSGTYIHAFDGEHKWLPTEACPSPSS